MKKLATLFLLICLLFVTNVSAQSSNLPTLYIPSINLWSTIVEVPIIDHEHDMSVVGYDEVGHMQGTGWPSINNFRVYIGAHNYLTFSELHNINKGDTIYIITDQQIYTYKVTDIQVVHYSDTSWLAGKDSAIVLQTCVDDMYRLIVYGELQ